MQVAYKIVPLLVTDIIELFAHYLQLKMATLVAETSSTQEDQAFLINADIRTLDFKIYIKNFMEK